MCVYMSESVYIVSLSFVQALNIVCIDARRFAFIATCALGKPIHLDVYQDENGHLEPHDAKKKNIYENQTRSGSQAQAGRTSPVSLPRPLPSRLGQVELGDGLSALRDGMLRELTGKDEAH